MRTIFTTSILLFIFAITTAHYAHADDTPPIDAGVIVVDAGTASGLPASASQLPDLTLHPAEAYSEASKAKNTSWALLVYFALVSLFKALAYAREKLGSVPIVGALAKWLATGKVAMVVAGIGAVGAAGYNVLVNGGTLVAALVVSGSAIAGAMHSTTQPTDAAPNVPTPKLPVAKALPMIAIFMLAIGYNASACTSAQKATATTTVSTAATTGITCAKTDLEQILASNGITLAATVLGYVQNSSSDVALDTELVELEKIAKADAIACAVQAASTVVPFVAMTSAAAPPARPSSATTAAAAIKRHGWVFAKPATSS